MADDAESDSHPLLGAAEMEAVFESIDEAVLVADGSGEIVGVNGTAVALFDTSRADLRRDTVAETLAEESPYTRDQVRERVERATDGESERFVWRGEDATGKTFLATVEIDCTVVDGGSRIVTTITERDDQAETKQRFRTMIDSLPGVVYRCRNEAGWPMEFVGGRCAEMTGYDASAIEAGDISWGADVIHPDDREQVRGDVQSAIEENESFEITYRIRTADDRTRWVWERGQLAEVLGDSTEILEGFITDITDQKELEEELRHYRQAVQWADTPIAAVDTSLDYLFANDAYLDVHASDRADITGENLRTVLRSSAYATAQPHVEDALDGTVVQYETTRTHPERGDRDFVARYYPIREPSGDVSGVVAVFYDITARNERESELERLATSLEEEREKYSTVVEQSHDAITIIQDEQFVFVNPMMERITGYDESELLDHSFLKVVAPADRELAQERYEKRLDSDASPPSRYELTISTADGEERIGELSASRIQYDGSPADLVSMRDVTAQKNYEAQLERQRDNLEVLNRMVRHDIRNDLQLILAYGELLADSLGEDSDAREHAETLLDGAEHAVSLTETARDLADAMLEDTDELTATSVRHALEPQIEELRSSYPEAVLSVSGTIPDAHVLANEMLKSVFRNLLQNAVQHNDKPVPEVTVSVTERDDEVLVRIADNGPGIPDTQKETIFGKGEKGLDSEGTGIGLYLVGTIVDNYRGDVWVEDRVEQGAASERGTGPSGDQVQSDDEAVSGDSTDDQSEGGTDDGSGAVFVVALRKAE